MRYAIFSDIHSNLEAFTSILETCKKEPIDKYLCIGDVVGYAANPRECIGLVKGAADVCVAGNHDWAAVDLFSADSFNVAAQRAIIWTRDNLRDEDKLFLRSLKLAYKNQDLTLAHGSLNDPGEFHYMVDAHIAEQTFKLMETDICFVGHTHVAGTFVNDRKGRIHYHYTPNFTIDQGCKYIINVGSIGQPRDNNPKASCCIYDSEKKEIRIKRSEYDIGAARKKIIDAGLPRFLGKRLLSGT